MNHHRPSLDVAKFVGMTLILAVLSLFFIFLLVLALEFGGVADALTKRYFSDYISTMPLHKTNYYGKVFRNDPYGYFYTQHLHPYYFFSAPWKEKDRIKAGNDIVSVDHDGFRLNPVKSSANTPVAVLLGGSVAFGQYASSNENSFASRLSVVSGYSVVNRNAPSWNAFQEFVALAKFMQPYNLSISLSTSNDMRRNCVVGEVPLDAPESYHQLAILVNDVRSNRVEQNLLAKTKNLIAEMFSDTAILYTNIKKSLLNLDATLQADAWANISSDNNCAKAVAGRIIENQSLMRSLSEARGARHLLVIQPQYSLHLRANSKFKDRDQSNIDFRFKVVSEIIGSSFCKTDCLNLSSMFDSTTEGPTHFKELKSELYSGKVFVDEVHMTDLGVKLVSKAISDSIGRNPK